MNSKRLIPEASIGFLPNSSVSNKNPDSSRHDEVPDHSYYGRSIWDVEEMEELEKTDIISTLCEEFLHCTETRPDPLLSITNGPINPAWDIWFEGPPDSQGCRCWIL